MNGAGKTTTFKTLTGDEIMTSGEAYLNGHSVKSELAMVCIKHFERTVVTVPTNQSTLKSGIVFSLMW